jgi:NAD(P)-dependent dehydrogenase (short-subunit alcohol dehydrogenase family)
MASVNQGRPIGSRSPSSTAVGSLTTNADPAYPYHKMFGPVYPASKAALNAITLAMMVELESTGIKVNLVSPGFTKTNLNGYEGTQSVEEGSREVVPVALLGPDGPTGTFTRWECNNSVVTLVSRSQTERRF